jgi:biopolymer transport protein ExbB
VAAFAGASQIRAGRDAARAAVDEAVEERATKLFRRIEYLNVIGNVSPMIGLLGTVLGMIQAFNRIFAAGGGMPDAGKLAGDIAVALVTTFWGLIIAIPALTTFAIFRNRIDAFAAECIKLCDGLLGLTVENATASGVAGLPKVATAAHVEASVTPFKSA